jgi:hypothetical protein
MFVLLQEAVLTQSEPVLVVPGGPPPLIFFNTANISLDVLLSLNFLRRSFNERFMAFNLCAGNYLAK